MSRPTMSSLISRVRFLTGAGTADFSDDDVQAALDQTRIDVHHEQLSAVVDRVGGGALQWREYRSRYRWFEATDGGTARFVVEDTLGSVRGTADWSADYQAGVVTFAQDQRGTSMFLSGHSFDPYGAAAELLDAWAARLAREFDFTTDGQSFSRSQQAAQLARAADRMRMQARPRAVTMVRPDVRGGGAGC